MRAHTPLKSGILLPGQKEFRLLRQRGKQLWGTVQKRVPFPLRGVLLLVDGQLLLHGPAQGGDTHFQRHRLLGPDRCQWISNIGDRGQNGVERCQIYIQIGIDFLLRM